MIERIPNFRLGPISKMTMWGTDKAYRTPYMTRLRVGRLSLHVFHRADADPDLHDHEEDFWTFPLCAGYYEQVMDPESHAVTLDVVLGWRWTHRRAEHAHRIAGTLKSTKTPNFAGRRVYSRAMVQRWPLVTVVWRAEKRREWGFWVHDPAVLLPTRTFIPWRDYIFTDWRAALALRARRRGAA